MVEVKYMGEYDYIPSIPAATIFIVLFGILTLLHCWRMFRGRTWFFIAFIFGGIFEIVGYTGRIVSSKQYPNYTTAPLAIQAVFILVAPSLLAASIYMELGRIMIITGGEHLSPIRRSWLTKIFVVGDVVSFLVQAGGAGMLVKVSTAEKGGNVIKVGLIIQIIFFGVFIITSIIFHVKLEKNGSRVLQQQDVPWKKHQTVLYFGSLLIFARSIFRYIEYNQGSGGELLQKEFWSYVFDAALMVLVMTAFNVVHPAEISRLMKERKNGHEMELLG
ncbi:RTA-like protein [Penicillium italicum]|uniref:RTA-like protein n=1 Tax=Penicillium italicum TaxID=40296 RepID=A0A0A2L8G6_PENIT|nr:RTA-like protein [Penicillium italicum]